MYNPNDKYVTRWTQDEWGNTMKVTFKNPSYVAPAKPEKMKFWKLDGNRHVK